MTRLRKCSRCCEPSDDLILVRGKWVCDVCLMPEDEEAPEEETVDRFERANEDLKEHRRGLGIE